MKKIRETNLLAKSRELLKTKKLVFPDQSALYYSTTNKLILPRKYNEQFSFKREDTIICHFCKRMVWKPYPHTTNFKQWHIDQIHKVFNCHRFDEDLEKYLKLKKDFEESQIGEK